MGDRAWAYVNIHPSHRGLFEPIYGDEYEELEFGDRAGLVQLIDEQANYGNITFLENLARQGIPFLAGHDAGGEYGDAVQASDGERFVDVIATKENDLVVIVNDDGEIDAGGLQAAREYLEVRRRALAKMKAMTPVVGEK